MSNASRYRSPTTGGPFAVGLVAMILAGVFIASVGAAVVRQPTGVEGIRLLVLCCGLALLPLTVAYGIRGRGGISLGHGIAGIGLSTAAVAGDGAAVWVGVALAGTGALWVIYHTNRRVDCGRSSV